MKTLSKWLAIVVAFIGVSLASTAHAQATRTWVSGVGDDVNPCSRTAPCKTFAGAISKTAASGEINCLDPGGYGAVTITKSITIDCTGTFGSTLASSTTGVIVNGANVHVRLRGLSINGAPITAPGINGVRFLQGSSLTIEDCVIFGFNGAAPNGFGVIVNATSGDLRLYINDTTIAANGAAASGGGIGIVPTGVTTVRAELNNVQFINNQNSGITVNTTGATGGSSTVSVENSRIAGNGGVGIATSAGASSPIGLMVNATAIVNNTTGIVANGATMTGRVGNSTITGNATGLIVVGGATLSSYNNNRLDGNPTTGAANNGAFSGTIIPH